MSWSGGPRRVFHRFRLATTGVSTGSKYRFNKEGRPQINVRGAPKLTFETGLGRAPKLTCKTSALHSGPWKNRLGAPNDQRLPIWRNDGRALRPDGAHGPQPLREPFAEPTFARISHLAELAGEAAGPE